MQSWQGQGPKPRSRREEGFEELHSSFAGGRLCKQAIPFGPRGSPAIIHSSQSGHKSTAGKAELFSKQLHR